MLLHHPAVLGLMSAYLLGSIPFGYLLVRVIYGDDVRQTGSGNIGATNVSRTSPALGLITLLLDALKGMAAVALVLLWIHGTRQLAFAAAFAAICGHIFPAWLGFRGGKGVATGLGSFVLLAPKAVLISMAVFLVLVAATRWIALASVVASASLPPLGWVLGEAHQSLAGKSVGAIEHLHPVVWLSAGALLIIVKHQANIRRMLAGTEPRFQLSNK